MVWRIVSVRLKKTNNTYRLKFIIQLVSHVLRTFSEKACSSRVSVPTKFGCQVLPPSPENDCSTWWEFGVMSDHTNRTKIVRPLNDSWPKSSPRPFLNSPI